MTHDSSKYFIIRTKKKHWTLFYDLKAFCRPGPVLITDLSRRWDTVKSGVLSEDVVTVLSQAFASLWMDRQD